MKIETIVNVKYKGKLFTPGSEIDVKKEIAEELIKNEAAKTIEESLKADSGGGSIENDNGDPSE